MPELFVVLPFIGLFFLFIPSALAKILGILVISIGTYSIYKHFINKVREIDKYAISIDINGGTIKNLQVMIKNLLNKLFRLCLVS